MDPGQPGTAWKNATIGVGASLSAAVDVLGWEVVGVDVPANIEGATLTLQGSFDGTNFSNLYGGITQGEWSIPIVTTGQVILLNQDLRLRGLVQIKVRTGSAAAPTVQAGADAVVKVILAPMSG